MSDDEYKIEPHSFVHAPRISRLICQKCGLLALRNTFSEWAVRIGCHSELHERHAIMRRKAGKR